MLVDGDGNELVDLGSLEPWVHGRKVGDKVHPVLSIEYKANSVKIEFAEADKDTILKKWREKWHRK